TERGIIRQLLDALLPGRDGGNTGKRSGDPLSQEPGAERRNGAVDDRQERAFPRAGTDGPGQLQAPPRRFVDFQKLARAIGRQAVDMVERSFLCLLQIIQNRSCGTESWRVPFFEPEAIEASGAEVFG